MKYWYVTMYLLSRRAHGYNIMSKEHKSKHAQASAIVALEQWTT